MSGGSSTAIPKAIGDASLRKKPSDLQAYEHVLRVGIFFHTWSKDNYRQSKAHLEQAIELAPDYARARHLYAYALLIGWISHFEESPAPPKSIIANAVKSVELDPTDYRAHRTAAFGHFFDKNLKQFDFHASRAMELAPNDAEVLAEMGALYTFSGNSGPRAEPCDQVLQPEPGCGRRVVSRCASLRLLPQGKVPRGA